MPVSGIHSTTYKHSKINVIAIFTTPQGLPPLTAVSGEAPSRVDTRSVLRPLRGAGLAVQAGRVLGSEPGSTGVQQPLPGAMMPRRLTPLAQPLTSIPEEKGKGPLNGRPIPKKSASPFEDVDGGGEGTTSASPPFETTRPLPPIAGTKAPPLPPIGGSNLPPLNHDLKKQPTPLPKFSGQRPGVPSMPSRQAPSDPFSTSAEDSQPPGSGAIPGSGPVRLPPTRPSISRAPPTPFASTTPKKVPSGTAAGRGGVASPPAGSDAGKGEEKSGTTK